MGFLFACAVLAIIWTLCPWWLALPITAVGLFVSE
jgi:hypothetical protein